MPTMLVTAGKKRGGAALSTTYSDMSESAGKFIKRYVVHPKDRSKRIFLILGIGHSSDECKVLGDFGSKYSKSGPTKDRGHERVYKKNQQTEIYQCYFQHAVDEIIL